MLDYRKDYRGNNQTVKVYDLEVDNDLTLTGDLAVTGDLDLAGGVAVAGLLEAEAGLKVLASGEYTTTGGNAVEVGAIASKGIEVGDLVVASIQDDGTSNVTLLMSEVTGADEITFTFSADPVANTVVAYFVLKA